MKNNENIKIKGRFIRAPIGLEGRECVWINTKHVHYVVDASHKDMCHVVMDGYELNFVNLSSEELVDIIMLLEV